MRIQLKKFAKGQIKSSGTYAKEAFTKSRTTTGVTVRRGCVQTMLVLAATVMRGAHHARHACSHLPQVGERAAPKSTSQYALQDLEVSADTDDSFTGARLRQARTRAKHVI